MIQADPAVAARTLQAAGCIPQRCSSSCRDTVEPCCPQNPAGRLATLCPAAQHCNSRSRRENLVLSRQLLQAAVVGGPTQHNRVGAGWSQGPVCPVVLGGVAYGQVQRAEGVGISGGMCGGGCKGCTFQR